MAVPFAEVAEPPQEQAATCACVPAVERCRRTSCSRGGPGVTAFELAVAGIGDDVAAAVVEAGADGDAEIVGAAVGDAARRIAEVAASRPSCRAMSLIAAVVRLLCW